MAFIQPSLRRMSKAASGNLFTIAPLYALRLRGFYDARARWHRRFYRLSGIMVILGGSALPVISTRSLADKDLIVSIIGVAISALTALRSFYRWDESWILLRKTEIEISRIYFDWKAQYDQRVADGTDTSPEFYRITSQMLNALITTRQEEAESFFRRLSFPHTS
jgi:Protein of unknown function (DUF4231)